MRMTLEDVADSAQSLATQYESGISAVEGATIMAQIQPEFAEFWLEAAKSMSSGRHLSECLDGVWPDSLVAVLRAGEHAGKTDAGLLEIEMCVRLQIAMNEEVGELKKPLTVLMFGTVSFLFMMLYVIPRFNSAMDTENAKNVDAFTQLSVALNAWITPIWVPLSIGLVAGIFFLVNWAKTDAGKETIIDMTLAAPLFGPAVRDFHYSVWARFMSMMDDAGIPLTQALTVTKDGLPFRLRAGITNFESDIIGKNRTVPEAANPDTWAEDDQRHDWPIYLRRAFIIGSNAGQSGKELATASKAIMKYAQRRFAKAVKWATTGAFILSACMVGAAALAFYLPILTSLNNLR